MTFTLQLRHDTAANWTSKDPVLASGEWGHETDTNKTKVGDGVTAWSSLGYAALTPSDNLNDLTDPLAAQANLKISALPAAACVATSNVALSGLQTIDGYTLAAGDIVLLTAQTTASQNGIYTAASGTWSRPTVFATGTVVGGRTIAVLNGSAYQGTSWTLLAPSAGVTVDTSSQTWLNRAAVTHVLHLADYGAKGDGITDDTLAVIAWCNAGQAIAASGGTPGMVVDPPPNFYLVGGYVPSGSAQPGVNCLPFIIPNHAQVRMEGGWNPENPVFQLAANATLPVLTADGGATWTGPAAMFASEAWCQSAPASADDGVMVRGLSLLVNGASQGAALTTGNLTSGSKQVVVASTTGIRVGMGVTDWTTPGNIPNPNSAPDSQVVVTAINTGTNTVTLSANAAGSGTGDVLTFVARWHGIVALSGHAFITENYVGNPQEAGIVLTNATQGWVQPTSDTVQECYVECNKVVGPSTNPQTPYNVNQHGIWLQKAGSSGVTDSFVTENVAARVTGSGIKLDSGGDIMVADNHPWACNGRAAINVASLSGSHIDRNIADNVGYNAVAAALAAGSNGVDVSTFSGSGTVALVATPVTTTGTTTTNSSTISGLGTTTGIYPGMIVTDSTHSSAIPARTQVISVGVGSVVLSNNAASSHTGDTLVFTPPTPSLPDGEVTVPTTAGLAAITYSGATLNSSGLVTALTGCTFLGEVRTGGATQAAGPYTVATGAVVSQVYTGIRINSWSGSGQQPSEITFNKMHASGNGHGTVVFLEVAGSGTGVVANVTGNRWSQDSGWGNADGCYAYWLSCASAGMQLNMASEVTVSTGAGAQALTEGWQQVGSTGPTLTFGALTAGESNVTINMATPSAPTITAPQTLAQSFLTPGIAESIPRSFGYINNQGSILTSGVLVLVAVVLPAGTTVSNLSFCSGGTAMVTPANWWFGLYDNSYNQLAVTADQTTAPWANNTVKKLAIAATAGGAASSFTTTYTGIHYVGIMVNAATVPSLLGAGTFGQISFLSPIMTGASDAAQTSPPAFPHTAATPTQQSSVPWALVS